MSSPKTIEHGSKVTLHYDLSLDNGMVVDDNREEDPVEIVIGDGNLDPAMEKHLIGMQAGDEKEVTLTPEEGFGFIDEDNVHRIPAEQFADMDIEIGVVISFEAPSGIETFGTIIDLEGDNVVVDFNHPLAGQTVTFDVTIVDVLS